MGIRVHSNSSTKYILFLVFLAIFCTEDTLVFGTISNRTMISIRFIIQIVVLVLLLFHCCINKVKVSKKTTQLFMYFSVCVFLSMIINGDIRNGYLFEVLIYLICFLILTFTSIESIFDIFDKTMMAICIFSIVTFFIRCFFPTLLSRLPIIENTTGIKFYFALFSNIPVTADGFIRNYGPFREPGVFQMFIIISLINRIFMTKSKLWKIIVLIIALLTTFSTTGYIALLFVVLALLFQTDNINRTLKWGSIIFLFIAILYLAIATDLLFKTGYGSVLGKLLDSDSISANSRIASLASNIHMFEQNPIFGKGITYVDENFSNICQLIFGRPYLNNTNTVFIQLARFGLPFVAVMLMRYYKFINNYYLCNKISTLCLFGALLCLLAGECMVYSVFLSLIMLVDNRQNYDVRKENV